MTKYVDSCQADDVLSRYGDIINLPHPVSRTHPPMAADKRAAQFSPFAALAGYAEAIEQAADQVTHAQE